MFYSSASQSFWALNCKLNNLMTNTHIHVAHGAHGWMLSGDPKNTKPTSHIHNSHITDDRIHRLTLCIHEHRWSVRHKSASLATVSFFSSFRFCLVGFAPEPGGYFLVSPMMIWTVFVVKVFLFISRFGYEANTGGHEWQQSVRFLNNEKNQTHFSLFRKNKWAKGDARTSECVWDGAFNDISIDFSRDLHNHNSICWHLQ